MSTGIVTEWRLKAVYMYWNWKSCMSKAVPEIYPNSAAAEAVMEIELGNFTLTSMLSLEAAADGTQLLALGMQISCGRQCGSSLGVHDTTLDVPA